MVTADTCRKTQSSIITDKSLILPLIWQLQYKPPIHADEIGLTSSKYVALNQTVSFLPLQISYAPLSLQVTIGYDYVHQVLYLTVLTEHTISHCYRDRIKCPINMNESKVEIKWWFQQCQTCFHYVLRTFYSALVILHIISYSINLIFSIIRTKQWCLLLKQSHHTNSHYIILCCTILHHFISQHTLRYCITPHFILSYIAPHQTTSYHIFLFYRDGCSCRTWRKVSSSRAEWASEKKTSMTSEGEYGKTYDNSYSREKA